MRLVEATDVYCIAGLLQNIIEKGEPPKIVIHISSRMARGQGARAPI